MSFDSDYDRGFWDYWASEYIICQPPGWSAERWAAYLRGLSNAWRTRWVP